MKKLKKILCFVLPIVFAVALTLGITLPKSKNDPQPQKTEQNFLAAETGASSADCTKKGGTYYLEPNSTLTMRGATISGSKNTYGGAVFISDGATFTMEGGTITGCNAVYGGAIYVASGGTCIIKGGKITNNTAEVAPAIYVENGGHLTLSGDPEIMDNTIIEYIPYVAGEDTILGSINSGITLKTALLGSYPQTYVGADMNATLESWYSGKPVARTYTLQNKTWSAYMYTDGYLYVRGTIDASGRLDDFNFGPVDYFGDGTEAITGVTTWIKVEPIKWYILNYEKWSSGLEDMELYSELVIAGNVSFKESTSSGNDWENSYIRDWCNNTFFYEAFDESEQEMIKDSTIGNNVTKDYENAESDTKGNPTTDKIYLKSYYEMTLAPFTDDNTRISANSDFAIANHVANSGLERTYATAYRSDRSGHYWLRSAGTRDDSIWFVFADGGLLATTDNEFTGVRPALRLNI